MHSVRDRVLVALLAVAVLPAVRGRLEAQQIGKPDVEVKKPASEGKPPARSKLEEMLAEALRNNPDICVATADVAKAEAELQRVRVQVLQQVVTLHYAIEKAQADVAAAQRRVDAMKNTTGTPGATSVDEYEAAKDKLAAAKLKLESAQAQRTALLGKAPKEARLQTSVEWKIQQGPVTLYQERTIYEPSAPPRPTSRMEKIRKALETPVKVNYDKEKLSFILKDLEKQAPGLGLRTPLRGDDRLTLQFEEPLPAAVALQAIEDELSVGGILSQFKPRFVIREYGILLTTQEAIPPNTWTPLEYLRRGPREESKAGK